MFVTPSGPNTSSRFGDASQCSVSLTSWLTITVGIVAPFVQAVVAADYLTKSNRIRGGGGLAAGVSRRVRRHEAPDRRGKVAACSLRPPTSTRLRLSEP